DVDAGGRPQIHLGNVRAAAVAARDERRARVLDLAQRFGRIGSVHDPGRVCFRPDDDEVVVHDGEAPHALTLAQEFLLGRLRMYEHDVRVASTREVERLARAERDDSYL